MAIMSTHTTCDIYGEFNISCKIFKIMKTLVLTLHECRRTVLFL